MHFVAGYGPILILLLFYGIFFRRFLLLLLQATKFIRKLYESIERIVLSPKINWTIELTQRRIIDETIYIEGKYLYANWMDSFDNSSPKTCEPRKNKFARKYKTHRVVFNAVNGIHSCEKWHQKQKIESRKSVFNFIDLSFGFFRCAVSIRFTLSFCMIECTHAMMMMMMMKIS